MLPELYPHLVLDAFAIMPDHVHCIMVLVALEKDGSFVYPETGIPTIMNTFKAIASRDISRLPGMAGQKVWQRGYMDRVARNDKEMEKFRFYIETNAQREYLQ